TLFHLDQRAGGRERLFVSILLHGNETAGLLAMQSLLADPDFLLSRPLSLFVGNIEAAKAAVRRLPGQIDFNRCWPGGQASDTPEGNLMGQLVDEMARHKVFASIDIHNNTGDNPHYGCINRLDERYIHLASLFSDQVVYFIRPTGVQSMAFAELCPAVTLECGSIGDLDGAEHAARFVRKVMQLDSLEVREPFRADLCVYHTVAQIRVPPDKSFSFDGSRADIMFRDGFETTNFRTLESGEQLARLSDQQGLPVLAIDENGRDMSDRYFDNENGRLVLKTTVIPSMLTSNETAIRQDCLAYFMELLDL
ncbi:MAG: succinylglutamate desuccinylase/aspartoacylase family protein, partial [Gammaproteobacteria bacterium]|nr:succinylglutamate desuccinylase/aspartoacylase family protein [Gammaproteobacteria bacterium]